ncbi:MAG: hypothetical protein IIA14_03780, partial [SAR324 cluster bacterium]|nr:hypothetical protein [SAR324 cluster bacterium]
RNQHGDEIANAVGDLNSVLTGDLGQQLSEALRKEALEYLKEIVRQFAQPEASKPVLRSIGISFWEIIEKVEPLSKACLAAWKIVEKFWI